MKCLATRKRSAAGNRRWSHVALNALVIAVAVSTMKAAAPEDFASHKRRVLAPLQTKYDQAVGQVASSTGLAEHQERLKTIDAIVELLVARLRMLEASSLDRMLSGSMPVPRPAPGRAAMTAGEVYLEYADLFGSEASGIQANEEQARTLQDYSAAASNAAQEYVAKRCRTAMAADPRITEEAIQLSAVLPLLHVKEQQWRSRDTKTLPAWMQEPRSLAVLEQLALAVRRPLTAYEFARHRNPKDGTGKSQTRLDIYLRNAAEQLLRDRDYQGALHCLSMAIAHAEGESQDGGLASLCFRRAEVLMIAGHAGLAAAEMKRLLEKHLRPDTHGQAAMLRLKYLYEAGQFSDVLEEAAQYRADDRSRACMPQILYIHWLTLRRANRSEEASKVQQTFLSQFPEHPLGADMHFAAAMTALSLSDYQEAIRLLELVEYRYPSSKLADKAKELQERLRRSAQATGASPP